MKATSNTQGDKEEANIGGVIPMMPETIEGMRMPPMQTTNPSVKPDWDKPKTIRISAYSQPTVQGSDLIEIEDRLDKILELLHNSWLEDDYDSADPNAIEAKAALLAWRDKAVAEALSHKDAMHASDVARAVGLLQGLEHPDEYLEKRLDYLKSQLASMEKTDDK